MSKVKSQKSNIDESKHISPTIFYICNDFERALGLELILPNFHIVCIDWNKGISEARKQGANIFCLEESINSLNPIFRNSNRLLQVKQVQEYIKLHTPQGTVPNVIFFKIAHNIEQTCKELGYNILNTTADLNQLFELKLSQFEVLNSINHQASSIKSIRFPKTTISPLKDINFEKTVKEIGIPFVIQYDRGHTGSSTVFVNNRNEFDAELNKYPNRMAKFSKKIDGEAWTLNACVTRNGIVYGGLCYQITGIKKCTTKLGGTVGNDWSVTNLLSKKSIEQIVIITKNSGDIMSAHGYKGLFGLDLVIDKDGEVYLIEINARQPASTGMHTKLLLQDNEIPLELLHIAEFLFPEDKDYISFINKTLGTAYTISNLKDALERQNKQELLPKDAAQVIIRNTSDIDINAKLTVETGIYTYKDSMLQIVREGFSISDIEATDEFLILASETGRIISPEAEVARLQMKKSAMILSDKTLVPNPEIIKIIEAIKND
jgi:hypothetical protein